MRNVSDSQSSLCIRRRLVWRPGRKQPRRLLCGSMQTTICRYWRRTGSMTSCTGCAGATRVGFPWRNIGGASRRNGSRPGGRSLSSWLDVTRALVIGGAGFVGTAACKELMRRGVETIAAGRKERPYGTFTSYVAFDRTDEDQLRSTLETVRPDVVLDLACYRPAEVSAVARNFKGERYVFISTGVYPHLHGKRAREEDFVPLEGEPPESLDYLEGKRWCETVLARTSDFPWTVIRPPAVFGPADHTLRIAAYIQRVADGGPLLVPQESYERQAGLAWVKDIGLAFALACGLRNPTTRKAYTAAL